MSPLRVAIVLHHRDARAERVAYLAWALREVWRERGIGVDVVHGPAIPAGTDVAVNHVDATRVPPEYVAAFERVPVAVNGRCTDVSKRLVSDALLGPGEPWEGPVIVKTDANCGGIGEERLRVDGGRALAALRRLAAAPLGARARERARWRTLRRIPSEEYPVFPSLAEVPPGARENPALVIERFLPEREGPLYALRTYYFLGDRAISRRVLSEERIVKASGVVRREDVDPHPAAIAAARRAGLDYGKVDYVVHGDRAYVLDVNRTPSLGPRLDAAKRRWTADTLAPGLESLVSASRRSASR